MNENCETLSIPRKPKLGIFIVMHWLLTQKWLWKKIVFDNGIVGKNYHRYDHRILPYCQVMGDNGKHGDVNTAIKWTIEALNRTCA